MYCWHQKEGNVQRGLNDLVCLSNGLDEENQKKLDAAQSTGGVLVINGKENRIDREYKSSYNRLVQCWATVCNAGPTLMQHNSEESIQQHQVQDFFKRLTFLVELG